MRLIDVTNSVSLNRHPQTIAAIGDLYEALTFNERKIGNQLEEAKEVRKLLKRWIEIQERDDLEWSDELKDFVFYEETPLF